MTTPAKLKMGFSGLSIPNFTLRCVGIKDAIANNAATFATPEPALATIDAAINQLSARQTKVEMGSGPDETILRNEAKTELHNLMRTLATYVAGVANGNADTILLSGFDIVGSKSSVGLLAPPNTIKTQADGLDAGTIRQSWKGVDRSSGYMTSIAHVVDGVIGAWTSNKATRLSHSFTDLTSGNLYAMRVATLSAAGQGPWSITVTHRPQ